MTCRAPADDVRDPRAFRAAHAFAFFAFYPVPLPGRTRG
jgi:hypothetical protein